jgi:4-alpha-glucanotransferase
MRRAGVLLHLSSLPSRGPIGDLGPSARSFLGWLNQAGLRSWQWLPLNPLGPGNSPYASPSALACEPALLSLEDLASDGLIELPTLPPSAARVDWELVDAWKRPLLDRAAAALVKKAPRELEAWARQQDWARDWALYAALVERLGGGWWGWPEEFAERDRGALAGVEATPAYRRALALQFLLDRQLARLRKEAERLDVQLIGDLPIFVSGDGCDTWVDRHLFRLDPDGRPSVQAGVPPDYFSATGQLWGNPHYDWCAMAEEDYRWWSQRLGRVLGHVHRVRIDHFRGFEAAWAVPREAETAMDGCWVEGPGLALFEAMGIAPERLIAEDLGIITPEVEALREGLGAPGMKVLQFAFGDEAMQHAFLPHNFEGTHWVVYTGTHDNETSAGWYADTDEGCRHRLRVLCASGGEEAAWDLVRLAWLSVAHDAIAPLQDLMGLGNEARLNVPGLAEGNWAWRVRELPDAALAQRVRELTWASGRLAH